MHDFTWWMQTYGPVGAGALLSLVGWGMRNALRAVKESITEVKANTADLPALRADVKTLGREMGERKAWERDHDRMHMRAAEHGD